MAPVMQASFDDPAMTTIKRYLLDTCAISRLATSSQRFVLPTAASRDWTAVVPWTILLELLQKLADEPTHSECLAACQFLLSIWPIEILPLSAIGWINEWNALPGSVEAYADGSERERVRSVLEAAVAGAAASPFGAERRRTANVVSQSRDEQLAELAESATRQPVTHPWERELKPSIERDAKTDLIISGYLPLLGTSPPRPDAEKQEALRDLIWTRPQQVPHWAGLTRVTLYTDWWHDTLRPKDSERSSPRS